MPLFLLLLMWAGATKSVAFQWMMLIMPWVSFVSCCRPDSNHSHSGGIDFCSHTMTTTTTHRSYTKTLSMSTRSFASPPFVTPKPSRFSSRSPQSLFAKRTVSTATDTVTATIQRTPIPTIRRQGEHLRKKKSNANRDRLAAQPMPVAQRQDNNDNRDIPIPSSTTEELSSTSTITETSSYIPTSITIVTSTEATVTPSNSPAPDPIIQTSRVASSFSENYPALAGIGIVAIAVIIGCVYLFSHYTRKKNQFHTLPRASSFFDMRRPSTLFKMASSSSESIILAHHYEDMMPPPTASFDSSEMPDIEREAIEMEAKLSRDAMVFPVPGVGIVQSREGEMGKVSPKNTVSPLPMITEEEKADEEGYTTAKSHFSSSDYAWSELSYYRDCIQ